MDEQGSLPSVDVVVVPRDRFSMFPRCLEALYAHTETPFRVIVVAGGSDRRTEAYLRRFEAQHDNASVVLVDRLLMQGEARILGLRHVSERYCVILENDTIVHENWLPPLFECMHEEHAAVVMPLIYWYGRIHAAGCSFAEQEEDGVLTLHHEILYTGIERRQIDYPECHCVLVDREQFPDVDIFEDVEPFDVDLGLTARRLGVSVFVEPRSTVTYSALPAWEVEDIPLFRFRWDPRTWEARNRGFTKKWGVAYQSSSKVASYRRQQWRLGVARWHPNRVTVGLSNLGVTLEKRLLSRVRS